MATSILVGFFRKLFGGQAAHRFARPNIRKLSAYLKYTFNDEQLLLQALKHRSYLAYTGEERIKSNERLELLGDAVLGLVVTEHLFKRFPNEEEGRLTNLKSLLVNRRNLSHIAQEFGLGEFLLLNDSEERSGGRMRESILADAVEAIIGAIYLDGGLEAAAKFIHENASIRLDSLLEEEYSRNFKSLLLEHCQSINLDGPFYNVEEESGPDHNKIFTVAAVVDGKKLGLGQGLSKKLAEQRAAHQALINLNAI
jgi:ribonuclease-3